MIATHRNPAISRRAARQTGNRLHIYLQMNLTQLAQKEAERLRETCEPIELERLDFDTLNGNSIDHDCLYGQLTGHPDSYRAMQLIMHSAPVIVCNDVENDGKLTDVKFLAPFIENYSNGIFVSRNGILIDPMQRSIYFVSPLELFVPGTRDPDRKERIREIQSWFCL